MFPTNPDNEQPGPTPGQVKRLQEVINRLNPIILEALQIAGEIGQNAIVGETQEYSLQILGHAPETEENRGN